MDIDTVRSSSRDRAVSSEPCASTRPFDGDEPSARKRQRVSSSGSARSRSVETIDAPQSHDNQPSHAATAADNDTCQIMPSTPTRETSKIEPGSSKVTLNLKHKATSISPSPSHPRSPSTPTGTTSKKRTDLTITSEDSASDGIPADPAIQTPSSSPSDDGSPHIEIISLDDDDDELGFIDTTAEVALLDDENNAIVESDYMMSFPYAERHDSLFATVQRIVQFFQYDAVDADEAFHQIHEWIAGFLAMTESRPSVWLINYVEYKSFWDAIPDLIWALNSRKTFFGEFLKRSGSSRRHLSQMLYEFASLTGRFVKMDVDTLTKITTKKDRPEEPALASQRYLLATMFLLRKDDTNHLAHNLTRHYNFDWDSNHNSMLNVLFTSGAGVASLTELARGRLSLISHFPKFVEALTDISRLVYLGLVDAKQVLRYSDTQNQRLIDQSRTVFELVAQYFNLMEVGLGQIIDKHITYLSTESMVQHIQCMNYFLQYAALYQPHLVEPYLENLQSNHPDLPSGCLHTIIGIEWKLRLLRSLITSSQMQLRVYGATTMCTELLNMFSAQRSDKDGSRATPPVLSYFAEVVLEMKIVDYIVGIGSHPEIILESGNIVGFLVATRLYSEEQTNMIWETVMTSQDPRVVDAILRMISSFVQLLDHEQLLYFCAKLEELPLEAFNGPMREHCDRILKCLINTATSRDRAYAIVEAPAFDLVVKLIRESSIPRPENYLGVPEVQTFALMKLNDLLLYGPDVDTRKSIYIGCIDDISLRAPSASGSICALLALVRGNLTTDLHMLTTDYNLTGLIVEELEHSSATHKVNLGTLASSPARQARRDLLSSIIIYEPATITTELGERLWNVLVGEGSQSRADRDTAWQTLNNVAKKTGSKNSFIFKCSHVYLPRLDKDFYTKGALDFAREIVFESLSSNSAGELLPLSERVSLEGVEEIWRMVLTAPPNTIETSAVNVLVELYLDDATILSLPLDKSHQMHSALIQRCLKQLSAAAKQLSAFREGDSDEAPASGDDEAMIIVASESQIFEQELLFTRSLILLREFLRLYHAKPQYVALKPQSPIIEASRELRGDLISVQYQTHDGNNISPIGRIEVGKGNTLASFQALIRDITKFKRFRMFHAGKEIPTNRDTSMRSMSQFNFDQNLLLLRRNDDEGHNGSLNSTSLSLESEIISHFDELWDYLGLDGKLAQEIYHFLITFPIYDKLIEGFQNGTATFTDMFVLGQPYKCLYSIHALREYLSSGLQQGSVPKEVLEKSIGVLVTALLDTDLINSCNDAHLRGVLIQHLSECVVYVLKEFTQPASFDAFLTADLLQRLLDILSIVNTSPVYASVPQLAVSVFESVLEACLHSPTFWHALQARPDTSLHLSKLILLDRRPGLRKACAKLVAQRCSFTPSLSCVSSLEFSHFIWTILEEFIPRTVLLDSQCEEALGLVLHVFRRLAEEFDESHLQKYLVQWGKLLTQHRPREEVGCSDSIDMVVRGFANLVYWCASLAKRSPNGIPVNNLSEVIFEHFLFPDIPNADSRDSIAEALPLLNSTTRKLLYDTIIVLTRDDKRQFQQVLSLLKDVVPYDQEDEYPYIYSELPWNFERSRAIRSGTGYVGLRNLSNTCYLNSLFTQLFMNVGFRDFMLNAPVADSFSAQKLLSETQKLFSHMQNSLRRFVDPVDLASSIRTYDETNIDVSIQMDVDEFYNLLFDRWEGQILASRDKKTFRSFYGGQLVQQVKSKECPHISERLEPFSAIQCDIKGKSSLQESLQAYVDGEVMEGDNKYKCSTCDKHVNAVKRACLKDIPNDLIFHLKRFDFNLRTLQRSKINDYFSFPHKIDMRPYKVEHLMETGEDAPEDVFELVGILVHSGTAESGHYYSYIRERPSTTGAWVEFNDDLVSPFDPSFIETNCFGGLNGRDADNGGFQFDKSWSAYMLFYQRSSVLQAQQAKLTASSKSSPIRVQISDEYRDHLSQENESLMRRYCLYDEHHAPFVLRMLENLDYINQGQCSLEHDLEKQVLDITLHHFDQVVARKKDHPDLAAYINALCTKFDRCAECCRDFLDWVIETPETLKSLIFRCPDSHLRAEFSSAIIAALSKVKLDAGYAYAGGDDEDKSEPPRLFLRITEALRKLWDSFHQYARAWPEYFNLLSSMARLGNWETAVLLDHGFLTNVIDCLRADVNLSPTPQYTRMLNLFSKRNSTKPVAFGHVIEFLETLLLACDAASEQPTACNELRQQAANDNERLRLLSTEHHLMTEIWSRGGVNILIEKLLRLNQNAESTASVVMLMLKRMPDAYDGVMNAITSNIRKVNSAYAVKPFMQAALTFCCETRSPSDLRSMISYIARVGRDMDNNEGHEHLFFWREILELPRNNAGISENAYKSYLVEQMPIWAPTLLTYYDPSVRTDTEDLVVQIILQCGSMVDTSLSMAEQNSHRVCIAAARRLGVECLKALQDEYVKPRTTAVRATLVSILAIINGCRRFYDDTSNEAHDLEFRELYYPVTHALKRLTIEEADEDNSDWGEGSNSGFTSSEIMESITDLPGGEMVDPILPV